MMDEGMSGREVGKKGTGTEQVGLVLVQREDMSLSETEGKMEDRQRHRNTKQRDKSQITFFCKLK